MDELVDNGKNQNYLRFYDLVYGHSTLKLRQNSGLGRSKEKRSFLGRSHGWIKIARKEKLDKMSLINENSIVGPQINNELAKTINGI